MEATCITIHIIVYLQINHFQHICVHNACITHALFLSCITEIFLTDGTARDIMIALDIALAFRKSDTTPVMIPPKSSTLQ